jgi:O-antigen/teichoic acid export membrane protein
MRYFSREKLHEMLSFGLKSFIQGAAGTVEKTSDRLVIGAILGPASIPIYTIPATLVGYISSVTATLSHTFVPLFSDLSARGQQHRIKAIYLLASKLLVGLIIPMEVGICLIGGPFISIWMEGEFDPVIVDAILVLLATYTLVPMLNPFASRYLTAINRHVIFAKVAPPAALVNLCLSIWLVFEYGVVGAALGSVLPVFVVMPVYLYVVCHNLEVSMLHYCRATILPAVIPVALMGGSLFWFRSSYGFDGYLDIVLSVLVSAVGYGLVYWFFSMGRTDREVLLGLLPRRR